MQGGWEHGEQFGVGHVRRSRVGVVLDHRGSDALLQATRCGDPAARGLGWTGQWVLLMQAGQTPRRGLTSGRPAGLTSAGQTWSNRAARPHSTSGSTVSLLLLPESPLPAPLLPGLPDAMSE